MCPIHLENSQTQKKASVCSLSMCYTVGKRANSSLVLFFAKIKEKNSTGVPLSLLTMMYKKKTNSPNYRFGVQKIPGDSLAS